MNDLSRRLGTCGKLSLAVWFSATASILAAPPEKLPTVELAFQASAPEGVQVNANEEAAFLITVHRTGGVVSAEGEPNWHIDAQAPFGEGVLDFTLDRAHLANDLALVLRADWEEGTDLAVQLFDAAGKPLALDLFGNLAQNASMTATDTFVVPLTRYPTATRLGVRRLSGPLTIHAAGLFPVLSEIPATTAAQQTIARQLGMVFPRSGTAVPDGENLSLATAVPAAATAVLGTVHNVLPLERVNQIGAAELAQTGYPSFQRVTQGTLPSVKMAVSGTTYDFVKEAVRTLALQSQSALRQPDFTSSDGVASLLLHNQATVGVMSAPLSSSEKERFFSDHGFAILEFKVAHDAIEVLVNAANPLTQLTIPQLDAIYAATPKAGARQVVRQWSDVGADLGAIGVYGGAGGWGTAKAFQQLVLKGGRFRPDIQVSDVVFRDGVESKVAQDPAGIGYVSLRPREKDVRVLAIAANSGEKAWPVDAEAIYSGRYPLQRTFYGYIACKSLEDAAPLERELINLLLSDAGQAMVAHSGSLPLSAGEIVEARQEAGLSR